MGPRQLTSLDADLEMWEDVWVAQREEVGWKRNPQRISTESNYTTCWAQGSASFYNVASRSLGCDTVGRGLAQHESLGSVSSTS